MPAMIRGLRLGWRAIVVSYAFSEMLGEKMEGRNKIFNLLYGSQG